MRKAPDLDEVLEELILRDKRIDAAESEGMRERWEFGKILLRLRGGKKRLPDGALVKLAAATGKSRRELKYRMQFAQEFPTEDELGNVLPSYPTWFAWCTRKQSDSDDDDGGGDDDDDDDDERACRTSATTPGTTSGTRRKSSPTPRELSWEPSTWTRHPPTSPTR